MTDQADKCEIIIFWSKEDGVFVADIPELPGCVAHGRTREDALKNAEIAARLWVSTAVEFGDQVPEPKDQRSMFA